MSKECVFCKNYALHKEVAIDRPIYTVAIVTRYRINGKIKGLGVDYNVRGCGYKLNYCPECGKRL